LLTNETLTSENNNSGIIDSCPGCGRPRTAYLIAKISKAKDLSLNLLTNVVSLSTVHVLWKKNFKRSLCYSFLLTHNRLMRCSSSVVNPVVVTALFLMSFLHC